MSVFITLGIAATVVLFIAMIASRKADEEADATYKRWCSEREKNKNVVLDEVGYVLSEEDGQSS